MSTAQVELIKINLRTGQTEKMREAVAEEAPIGIYLNGEHLTTMMASPERIDKLVLGFLIGGGIVKSIDEIADLSVKDLKVNVKTKGGVDTRIKAFQTTKLISTACGSIEAFHRLLDRIDKPFVDSKDTLSLEVILKAIAELNEKSSVFRLTGGTHAAAVLSFDGDLLAFAEDVGRHNAVDKVIGEMVTLPMNLHRCLLASTGRQSSDMILKVARVGIPIVASIAGPLHTAVYIAEKTGLTLVCFVRGRRMNVYTHPERITPLHDAHRLHNT